MIPIRGRKHGKRDYETRNQRYYVKLNDPHKGTETRQNLWIALIKLVFLG